MSAKYRYPGTEPFSTADKDLFFGRDEDIEKLYQTILLEQITVLHGKSGYGKTSILRAGILPKLEKEENLRSFYIRPGRYNPEEGVSLLDNFVQKAFNGNPPSSRVLEELGGHSGSLWYYFKSLQIENPGLSGFVLILDQFEECFTYTPYQLEAFKKEFSELLFVKLPQQWRDKVKEKLRDNPDRYSEEVLSVFYAPVSVKVVFSIRSDKLSQMDQLKDYFPNILQNNFVLDALKRPQASQAITQPARLPGDFISPPFRYSSKALDRILNFLANKINHTVEAFQLQMVCQYIEMYVVNDDKMVVEAQDLENLEEIVENFYDKQIERLGNARIQDQARSVMEKLIFEEDLQRIALYEKQIIKELDITPELLNKMVECRLVRAEVSPSTGAAMYEITHDTLVLAVVKSKKRREQESLISEIAEKSRLQRQVNSLEKKWRDELSQINSRIEQYKKDNPVLQTGGFVTDLNLSYLYSQRAYFYTSLKEYDKALADYDAAIRFDPESAHLHNSKAIVHYDTGQYEEAVAHYLEAIELNPDQIYFYTNIGLAYEKLQQYDKAAEYYNKALIIDPDYAEAYNSRGNVHLHNKNLDKARTDYERALDLNPDSPIYWRNLGAVFRQQGDYASALDCYEKAIKLDPSYPDAYNSRGNILFSLKKYEEAIADYQRAIERMKEEPIFYRNLGLALDKVGQKEPALKAYDEAIRLNPAYGDAYNSRGNIYYDLKMYKEAIADYQKAIECQPDMAAFYRNLGLVSERTGKREQAMKAYNKALELDPAFSDAYNSRGNIFYDLQQYDRATADYLKAIEHQPDEPIFYRNLGLSYEKMNQLEKAIESHSKAIDLDPAYPDAYNSRGNNRYNLQRYEEAIPDYLKAIELQEGEAVFHRNLGLAYDKVGKKEKALECYNRALALNPAYADAYNSRGNIYYDQGNYDKAIADYKKALEHQPEDAIFWRNLGMVYELTGELEKAEEAYLKGIAPEPDYADIYNSLGVLYQQQEKYQEALTYHEKAVELAAEEAIFWRNYGLALNALEQYDKALEAFNKASALSSGYADPLNDIGNIYYNKFKDYQKAAEYYKKATEMDPQQPVFWTNLAYNNILVKDVEGALSAFNKAVELEPDSPAPYVQRGGFFQDYKQDPGKALDDYEKALSLEPDEGLKGEIYRNKAELFAGKKEVEKAEHFFELAEPLKEADSFYYFLKAKICAAKGDKEGFYQQLRKSLDTEPVHRFYHYLDQDTLLQPFKKEKRFQELVEAFKEKSK